MGDQFRLIIKISPLIINYFSSELAHYLRSCIHRLTYRATPSPLNIVIIGGSFTGAHLAKRLSQSVPSGYRVILIEKNSHFNYTFNFPRYSVVKGCEQKAFVPFTGLLKGSPEGSLQILRDTARDVGEGSVKLESGEEVKYEYLAITTGATQSLPAKVRATTKVEGRAELREMQGKIEKAHKIAIVGGGAVGIQLAGDIKSWYEDKHVTLIHSRDRLLSNFGSRLGDFVAERLRRMDIRVLLSERPNIPQTMEGKVPLLLKNEEETFDLLIPCTGQNPNSSFLSNFLPSSLSLNNGRILTKPTLQILVPKSTSLYSNIFALGDVAETKGVKMARAGMQQAEIVQRNILSLINGKTELEEYTPSYFEGALKLSLGKNENIMYLRDGQNDFLIPGKGAGEDLSVKQAWSMLGVSMKDCEI